LFLKKFYLKRLSVLQTRATPLKIELVVGNHETFDFSTEFFGAILQYPGKYGQVYDYAGFIAKAAENEIKVAVAADILSLAKLTSPGEMGAAVVVGTTQRFGIPMGYGGPHAGKRNTNALCREESSVFLLMPTENALCVWHWELVSNTSNAKKRLPTSVPHKFYLR